MKHKPLIWFTIAFVIFAAAIWIALREPPREPGRTANPDATWTIAIGQARLAGLLGIEIVFAVVDDRGTVLFSTGVEEECSSWSEARRKHS